MKLSELASAAGVAFGDGDVEIAGITADSREVGPGFLFAALAGSKMDGGRFVRDALDKGAAALLVAEGTAMDPPPPFIPVLTTANTRAVLARMAAAYFREQPATTVAVTGTNGKTSVAAFTRQIWDKLGIRAGSLGTVGAVSPLGEMPLAHTTPDPVTLHRMLADLAKGGVDHLALEASSHGLEQHRLDGVTIAAAAFTNITRDHLDYHGDFESYFRAKLRLFSLLPAGTPAIINADDPESARVAGEAEMRGLQVITVGQFGAGLKLAGVERDGLAQRLTVRFNGRSYGMRLPLAGDFQASNALVAAALVIATGGDAQAVFATLETLEGAKGRLELAGHTSDSAPIFIDYAHTPDALQKALETLRPYAAGKLAVVFGCGGDRDRGKRPQMGAIAARLADRVYVTDDNPRTEDAAAIRAEIMAAAPAATEIGDRSAAIAEAIRSLQAGDALLIAGKGHETGQIVGAAVIPYTDHNAVRTALDAIRAEVAEAEAARAEAALAEATPQVHGASSAHAANAAGDEGATEQTRHAAATGVPEPAHENARLALANVGEQPGLEPAIVEPASTIDAPEEQRSPGSATVGDGNTDADIAAAEATPDASPAFYKTASAPDDDRADKQPPGDLSDAAISASEMGDGGADTTVDAGDSNEQSEADAPEGEVGIADSADANDHGQHFEAAAEAGITDTGDEARHAQATSLDTPAAEASATTPAEAGPDGSPAPAEGESSPPRLEAAADADAHENAASPTFGIDTGLGSDVPGEIGPHDAPVAVDDPHKADPDDALAAAGETETAVDAEAAPPERATGSDTADTASAEITPEPAAASDTPEPINTAHPPDNPSVAGVTDTTPEPAVAASAPLWRIGDILAATRGSAQGVLPSVITGVSIDSRTLNTGDLFVAIKGDRTDGHDYVTSALRHEAAAALVSKEYFGAAGPLIRVVDPLRALNDLGRAARGRTDAKIIAVTGSVGKTSSKEMLRTALSASGATHASEKSYNNLWGVPLSLARMPAGSEFGVFEIGMNHAGEITPLTQMVRPHIAIVTTVGPVHLEFFPDVEAIAEAKAEIFLGLEPGGTAIIHRDIPQYDILRRRAEQAKAEIVSFGEDASADARLVDVDLDASRSWVRAAIFDEIIEYELGAPGRHLALNSLAVLAAVAKSGADMRKAAAALAQYAMPEGRGVRETFRLKGGNVLLIDESYNANPTSMRAAIAVLGQTPRHHHSRRIAVIGDMLELGHAAEELHAKLAEAIDAEAIDVVFACGKASRALYDALPAHRKRAYAETSDGLKSALLDTVKPGDAIMVKGSLGSRMGLLVSALKDHMRAQVSGETMHAAQ